MVTVYVTSDQPRAGRTALCAALGMLATQRGKKAAVFKPLTLLPSGDASRDVDTDFLVRTLAAHAAPAGDSGPWPVALPASQLQGALDEAQKGLTATIQERVRQLSQGNELLALEGLPIADGQGTPLRASGELAEAADARAVGVVRYTPGMAAGRVTDLGDIFGERLAGVVLNQVTRYKGHEVRTRLVPEIEASGIRVLGVIPEDRRLLALTVGQVVDHLGGLFLGGDEKRGDLVEHFLIGGLFLESGAKYFGRYANKAVIVRGDRPDIQMAALSDPTKCLILTGGLEPTQYVRYEAEEEDVPLVVVPQDTHQTAASLEGLTHQFTFHHPAKLERFQELLAQHVDVEILLAALGL